MTTVHVSASKEYDVIIGGGLLGRAGELIRETVKGSSVMIVSDDIVYPLYGVRLSKELSSEGFRVFDFVFPNGEVSKNLTVYGQLLDKLCDCHFSRSDAVIAVGGGVVGDLAGFAAATYKRGIDVIQIPTTLLAAVDSSVGGKTAVNLSGGKNQAGCFWQPSLVICDTDTLSSLPGEQLANGSAEVIKYGVICDEDFFERLRKTAITDDAETVIAKCVGIKRDIVGRDEYDTGERMLLNFGHTFGHAAELRSGYKLLHGFGVAMGMAVMTRAAVSMGCCSGETLSRLTDILHQYSLPAEMPYGADEITDAVTSDKKLLGGDLRIVVPKKIGECAIKSIPVRSAADWVRAGGLR